MIFWVVVDGNLSSATGLDCGVPQGSVLGPLLFSLYTSPISDILKKHNLNFHLCADDTQIYAKITTSNETQCIDNIEACINDLKAWMIENRLKLNEDKTEVLVLGKKSSCNKLTVTKLCVAGSQVDIVHSGSVRNLGFFMDSQLSMTDHITKTCGSLHYHLKNIGKIRQVIDIDTAKLLVNSFITSKLDYCNSLFTELPNNEITRLQKMQNKSARLVSRTKLHEHIQTVLQSPLATCKIPYTIQNTLLCF